MQATIVKKASVRALNGRLTQPFNIASGGHARLENVLFTVELADGTQGYGEAAPATHITGETQAVTLRNLEKVAQSLPGHDAGEYLTIAQEMREWFPKNHCAATAVEMALLDSVTRSVRLPLWRLFGPKCHALKTDMTVVLGSVEEASCLARNIYRKGIRAFKIKVGRNFSEDLERVRAVARVAGKLPIYLDANEGYTEREALEFLRELRKSGIQPAFFEQPVSRQDWDGLKKLARESGVCIGADESINSLADVGRVIREKAATGVNIKLMKFGITYGREMARLSQAAGLKLMIGGMMESLLAMTCSAHLAAGLGGFDFIDLDTPFFISDKVMRGGGLSAQGVYDLSSIPKGIGVVPYLPRGSGGRSNK